MTDEEQAQLNSKQCIRCGGDLTKSGVLPQPRHVPAKAKKVGRVPTSIYTCMNECGVGYLFDRESKYVYHANILNHGYTYRILKLKGVKSLPDREIQKLYHDGKFYRFLSEKKFISEFHYGETLKSRDVKAADLAKERKDLDKKKRDEDQFKDYNLLFPKKPGDKK